MKLKSILSLAAAIVSMGVLAGCHETRTVIIHEQAPVQQMNGQYDDQYDGDYSDMDYPPVQPQVVYTNYYGSPQYGYWSGGLYHFYNPYGMAAIQTNSYLLSAGLNGLAAYIGTRAALHSAWNVANPNGYHVVHHSTTKYIGRGGKVISKQEALRRQAQSKRDRKAYKAKQRKQKRIAQNRKRKQQKARQQAHKSYMSHNNSYSAKYGNKSNSRNNYSSSYKNKYKSSHKHSKSRYNSSNSSSSSSSYHSHKSHKSYTKTYRRH